MELGRAGNGKWYFNFGIGSDTESYRSNRSWQKICDVIIFIMWQMYILLTQTNKSEKKSGFTLEVFHFSIPGNGGKVSYTKGSLK